MIENSDKPKNKVTDVVSEFNETQENMKRKVENLVENFLKNHEYNNE